MDTYGVQIVQGLADRSASVSAFVLSGMLIPPILWQLNKNPINDIVKDAARGNFTSDEPAAVSLEDAYCIFEIFEDGGRNAYED